VIFDKEQMTFWSEMLRFDPSGLCLFEYRVCLARMEVYGDSGESGRPTDQQVWKVPGKQVPPDTPQARLPWSLFHHHEHATKDVNLVMNEKYKGGWHAGPCNAILDSRFKNGLLRIGVIREHPQNQRTHPFFGSGVQGEAPHVGEHPLCEATRWY
jgi:hypothetical protein